MKVVSLFDGISCGRVALERAGLPVSRYVAFEIDQNAINCSNWNYPDIEHRGSVVGRDFSEFIGFDIVMGGFPCQDLSLAGKRKGLKGKRSSLFWYLAEAIEVIKPRYFLVENNVGMPKEAKETITKTLGVEPIQINSALVSAQTRKRLYWTNIPGVEQPEDRGVILKDILEDSAGFIGSGAVRGRYVLNEEGVKRVEQKLEFSQIDKSNALTTVCKDNVILIKEASKLGYTEIHKGECFDANYMGSTTRRGRRLGKKAHCVTAKNEVYFYQYLGGRCFRKFTPVEYERLQTLPDGYTEMLSDTQRYRTLGNGWNVDTIAHILNYINIDLLI